MFELGLEILVRFFGQGEQQYTRGVHIEAVDDERSRSCGITLPSPVEDRRSFRFPGTESIPAGLKTAAIQRSSYRSSGADCGQARSGSGSTSSPRSMWARIGPHLPRQAG